MRDRIIVGSAVLVGFLLALILMDRPLAARQQRALVSTAFTYQGELLDGDAPANGAYDFQFRLWDGPDTESASQIGNTETKNNVAVEAGRFTVSLDFGDVFDGEERYLQIAVRLSGSGEAYTYLEPLQPLSATPYAIHAGAAAEAPWSGLTDVPAGFADGVDDDTTYTAGDGLELSGGAFSLAPGYQLPQACANGELAQWDGSAWVCAADENTTYTAGDGLRLQGNEFNVATLPMMGWSDTLLDSGNVGDQSSIIIGLDGLPVISYYDANNGDLKVAHCNNMACTSATTTTVDSAGVVGKYTSITIGRTGYPLISYYDDSNGDLKLANCNNVTCTSATLQTVDSTGDVGLHTSITVNEDGYAFISYYDATNGDLKAVSCNTLTCSGNTIWTVDSAGDVGQYTSVTRNSNDYGYISYYDATNGDLKVARCVSMSCGSGSLVINTVDGKGTTGSEEDDVGHHSSITTGTDGLPLIAYAKVYQEGSPSSGSQMRVAHCTSTTCSAADVDVLISASTLNWQAISITLGRDGLGLISAGFDTTSRIYVFHCDDVACSGQTISDSVVTLGAVDAALTVGADGLPILSYYTDVDDALRVVHCSDWSCQPYLRRR